MGVGLEQFEESSIPSQQLLRRLPEKTQREQFICGPLDGTGYGVLRRSVLLPTNRPWHALMKVKQEECEIRPLGCLLIKQSLTWLRIKLNIEPRSSTEQHHGELTSTQH